MSVREKLHDLAFETDLKAVRFTLSLGAIFIGLGFAWPAPIFPSTEQIAAGAGRHTYALMAQIAPEWVWSAAFLAQGSVMLWSLVSDYRSRFLLWADAAFGVILWSVAIGACYLAYWRGFGRIMEYRPPAIMGGEVAAVLAQWWVFVRYHLTPDDPQNMRITDRRKKAS